MWYLYVYRGHGKQPRLIDCFDKYVEAVEELNHLEAAYPLKEYYLSQEEDEDAL